MSKIYTYVTKRDAIIWAIIALVVLVVGLILMGLGFNEGFYVPDAAVRKPFEVLTDVGSEMAYVVLLALLLFAIDWKLGRALIVQFMINLFANSLLKDIFQDPRPQWNYVDGVPIEESYGFPSGHSQNAMAFWGHTFFWKKNVEKPSGVNKGVMLVSLFFLVVLPVSRLIIGVHDLEDVIGGTVLGIAILVGYLLVYPLLEPIKNKPVGLQVLLGVTLALTLWVIVVAAWPQAAEGVGQAAGLLVAAAIGFPIEEKTIGYDPASLPPKKRVLCGLIGLVITFIFYFGLGAVFGLLGAELAWVWRFVRYIILGLILILAVPWVLRKTVAK